MNRKLLALDIVLAGGVIYGGFQLHSELAAARARQAGMPGPAPKAAPVQNLAPLPPQPTLLPSGYSKVAQQTLFDPTRNPNVPVDPPPPPPPPKEPPPLPTFHGMMDLGDKEGAIALITDTQNDGYLQVHKGEMIGEFKLLSFNLKEMTLDWEGRVIHKRLDENANDGAQAKPQQAGPPVNLGIIPGQAPAQPAPAQQQPTAQLGPGQDMGGGVKTCQAGDASAAGTVTDGYRKEVHMTPFGTPQCFWKEVGK